VKVSVGRITLDGFNDDDDDPEDEYTAEVDAACSTKANPAV